jgi:hypothetical protein
MNPPSLKTNPSRVLLVESSDLDGGEFARAVEKASATHVLFLSAETPVVLSEIEHLPVAARTNVDSVRHNGESLIRVADVTLPGDTFYARSGVIMQGDDGPLFMPAAEPLDSEEDARSLVASKPPAFLAELVLPGERERPAEVTEVRRCPGPPPHWVSVSQDSPVCPEHNLPVGG